MMLKLKKEPNEWFRRIDDDLCKRKSSMQCGNTSIYFNVLCNRRFLTGALGEKEKSVKENSEDSLKFKDLHQV